MWVGTTECGWGLLSVGGALRGRSGTGGGEGAGRDTGSKKDGTIGGRGALGIGRQEFHHMPKCKCVYVGSFSSSPVFLSPSPPLLSSCPPCVCVQRVVMTVLRTLVPACY